MSDMFGPELDAAALCIKRLCEKTQGLARGMACDISMNRAQAQNLAILLSEWEERKAEIIELRKGLAASAWVGTDNFKAYEKARLELDATCALLAKARQERDDTSSIAEDKAHAAALAEDEIRTLHRKPNGLHREPVCWECGEMWPCPTRWAVDCER